MDDAAYSKLLTAAMPTLAVHARKLTRNRERAEDLLQDTMLKAWEKRALYKEGNYLGWLRVMMRNTFINAALIEGRMKYTDNTFATGSIDSGDDDSGSRSTSYLEGRYLSEGPNQEDFFLENQIHAAIATLEPHTALLIQQKLQGLTYEQIGKALGIKANNAKQRYFNDIKTLRALLLKLGLLDN